MGGGGEARYCRKMYSGSSMRSKVFEVDASAVTSVARSSWVRALKKGKLMEPEGVNQELMAGREEKVVGGKRQGSCGAKWVVLKRAGVALRRRGR